MKDIFSVIHDSFKTNRASVLGTIINQSGSSPRGVGSKLLIMKDGALTGSIGGGILEKAVIEASSKVFSSSVPLRFKSDPEMSCGGDVEIFLEPVSPYDKICVNIFNKITDILKRGGSGLLATVVDTNYWRGSRLPKALFKSNGEVTGVLPGMIEAEEIIKHEMPSFLESRRPGIITFNDKKGNEVIVFIEPIISEPVLYVFGAGHVSSKVVPLARRVGFRIIVIDDRPEFADPFNFPDADKVFHYSYEDVFKKLPIDESSFIVIATRAHSCDEMVLGQALRTDAGYIGMIGSRRKISGIYDNLMESGFKRDDIERVHSPIGIDIGAETPEEIALSIVAELVKVRAG